LNALNKKTAKEKMTTVALYRKLYRYFWRAIYGIFFPAANRHRDRGGNHKVI